MNATPNSAPDEHLAGCVALGIGDTLRIVDPHAMLVYVPQGVVWITEEGGGEDIVLREGEWCRLRRPGAAVAEALAPAVLLLTSPSAERPARMMATTGRPEPSSQGTAAAQWNRGWRTVQRWWHYGALPARNPAASS